MTGFVVAVHRSSAHAFGKVSHPRVRLVEGWGVEGDAHAGVTVQHRSRVARTPSAPNLRQVHLLPVEVLADLRDAGFAVAPGQLGENVTTSGVDLLALPVGARLTIGEAVVTVTGLRNPCRQIEDFSPGILAQLVRARPGSAPQRRAGIMAVVSRGGVVGAGDRLDVELPPAPHHPLAVV